MKAFVFPGQGAQFVGMGKDLYENSALAKELFEKANDILGYRITDIMFNGTDEDLRQTKVTQPAVFLHSVISALCMGDDFKPEMTAGHSLGEFSALVAAGALSFEDGLKLVYARAMAMQKACEAQPSTMAAIIALPDEKVEEICAQVSAEGEVCVAANYNCPGQIVISGSIEGINKACELMKAAGAKRALPLKVGGAFHSPLMNPAKVELEAAINATEIHAPKCPVYQNVDAMPHTDPVEIKKNLVAQLTASVRWTQTVKNMVADGARMNTAHLGREGAEKLINNVRSVSNRIAILMDTKGPEVRTTVLAEPIPFKAGDRVKVVGNPEQETTRECISVSYPHFVKDLNVDGHILIDDGDLELVVVEKTPDYLLCEVQNEATLGSRKSVNVPGVRINLPSLTEKDRTNILYAIEKNIDFIAHSFVRNKQDILDIKAILDAHNSDIRIVAKIENQEGVDNIDEILEVADGVMIARGDLGIEVPQERIPGIQRVLIRKCILAKKPVIVATQMLHTMISNPRPTRAEVTDIANAIYYRTDALMLSGETAYGKYPVEAVKTMTKIAAQAEKDKLSDNDIRIPLDENSNDVTAFLAKQAVKATTKLKIRAIITDSYSGRTARNLAAFRGKYPVLAICYKEKTMRHLALSYGVEAIYMPELANGQEYYFAALRRLLKEGRLCPTDMVGYLSSGKEGTQTSFLEINVVEDALKHAEDSVLPNSNRYL